MICGTLYNSAAYADMAYWFWRTVYMTQKFRNQNSKEKFWHCSVVSIVFDVLNFTILTFLHYVVELGLKFW